MMKIHAEMHLAHRTFIFQSAIQLRQPVHISKSKDVLPEVHFIP